MPDDCVLHFTHKFKMTPKMAGNDIWQMPCGLRILLKFLYLAPFPRQCIFGFYIELQDGYQNGGKQFLAIDDSAYTLRVKIFLKTLYLIPLK